MEIVRDTDRDRDRVGERVRENREEQQKNKKTKCEIGTTLPPSLKINKLIRAIRDHHHINHVGNTMHNVAALQQMSLNLRFSLSAENFFLDLSP